jgi:hypothetical protein
MIKRRLEEITPIDLLALVDGGVSEGRTIEYKQELPGNGDDQKKEFLADVSSFANAGGGDLIYGVEEEREKNQPTGIPKVVIGLSGINADKEVLRLQQIVREGIDPRISGVGIRAVDGFASGPSIVIRIPRSLAAPHMVKFKNSSRFYSRTSAGKYQLDVHEIRAAFELSGDFARRMRDFVAERVGRIVANDTVVHLRPGPVVVLHVLPFASFDPAGAREVPGFASADYIEPFCGAGTLRLNFDGKLAYSWDVDGSKGYAEFFRNGILEIVDADMCWEQDGAKRVRIELLETSTRKAIIAFLRRAQLMQLAPPYFVILSLSGFRGAYLCFSEQFFRGDPRPFDRDSIQTPEVVIESAEIDVARIRAAMRPAFDTLWQASGYKHSLTSEDDN